MVLAVSAGVATAVFAVVVIQVPRTSRLDAGCTKVALVVHAVSSAAVNAQNTLWINWMELVGGREVCNIRGCGEIFEFEDGLLPPKWCARWYSIGIQRGVGCVGCYDTKFRKSPKDGRFQSFMLENARRYLVFESELRTYVKDRNAEYGAYNPRPIPNWRVGQRVC
jgi:hypothetical protein